MRILNEIKIRKKSNIFNTSKTFIFHNNNAEKLSLNYLINKQRNIYFSNLGKNGQEIRSKKKLQGNKAEEKIAEGKNGRWEKAEGKNRNNIVKSNFLTTANIFAKKFFLRLLNLVFEPILSESSD